MSTPTHEILSALNVRVTGNRLSRRSMVFSHGFGTDQTIWETMVPAFTDDHQFVLLDHAGSGHSNPAFFNRRRQGALHGFAEDLAAVLQALNLRDCVLVGHSAGAIIGMLAAIQAPACFSQLVLIGASARYQNDLNYEGGFVRDDFIELYRLMMSDYAEWKTRFASLVTAQPSGSALHTYLTSMLGRLEPQDAMARARTVLESDYREWLSLVTHPTLLLQAAHDPVVPRPAAEYLQQQIAGSRLRILEGSGHFAFLDFREQFVAAIREFVRDWSEG